MNGESLNIALRRISPDDAAYVDAWRNQPSTRRFQASPKRTIDQIREMLAEHAATPVSPQASGRFSWLITAGGEPAGTVQFTINGEYDRRHNNAHLGYMIAEGFQGRGVATRAVTLVTTLGFDPDGLAIERIEAVAAVDNVASRRVLEKAGYQFEGIRRKLLIIDGIRTDHAAYARLVTDRQAER